MKIKYKFFFNYENKGLEYFLYNMKQKGYELVKVYGDFYLFSPQKNNYHYCVLGFKVSDNLESKYSLLRHLGWSLVGQNGTFAIFSNENCSPPIQTNANISKVKKSIRNHIVSQIIYIVFAITIALFIYNLGILKREDSLIMTCMFFWGLFTLITSLVYFLAEMFTIINIRTPDVQRTEISCFLFSIGDAAILVITVLLILISAVAILNISMEVGLYIILLWIIWLIQLLSSSIKDSNIVCSLAFNASIIFSLLLWLIL